MAKILLVAGHGAGDPGACAGGFYEADLTREVAEQVQARLSGYADIFDTSLNMYKFLKGSGSFDFSGYDYILEIHFNAGANKNANSSTTGTEILIHTSATPTGFEDAILNGLSAVGFRNRGIKRRSDLQNMNIMQKKGVNYALLEVCFIDDPDDMKLFADKKEETAAAIVKAAADKFGIMLGSEEVKELVSELALRGIVTNRELWLKKLAEDSNACWLAKKTVKYLKEKQV